MTNDEPALRAGSGDGEQGNRMGLCRGNGAGLGVFVLVGISVAAAIQGLYARVFELRPRGANDMPRKLHSLASGGSRCGS